MTDIFCARAPAPRLLREKRNSRRRKPGRPIANPRPRPALRLPYFPTGRHAPAKKALFLDRDGVLNRDSGYAVHPYAMRFCHRVLPLVRRLQRKGYLAIVVTNQSGLDRGLFTKRDFLRCTRYMLRRLHRKGVAVRALYYCPAALDDDPFRKPGAGMLLAAAAHYGIDLGRSVMIGDRASDRMAGMRAGVGRCILLPHRRGRLARPRLEGMRVGMGEWQ